MSPMGATVLCVLVNIGLAVVCVTYGLVWLAGACGLAGLFGVGVAVAWWRISP